MATLKIYRECIQNLLTRRSKLVWDGRLQVETIFDLEKDRYQLVCVGWRDGKRIYGVVLHVDIINGKIWIQKDGTERGIANELVSLGIPAKEIVLGFDPPKFRHLTNFAVE